MSFPKNSGNPQVMRQCEQCETSFRTRNQDKKFCSDDCRKSAQNARQYQKELHTGVLNSELEDAHV